jgi:BASS family bile acid:Na+ symporter
MDAALVIRFLVGLGVGLVVIAIGVSARPRDTLLLIRKPQLGLRAMLAMFVLVPAFVLLLTSMFPLDRPLRAALLALAVSPMPPIILQQEIEAGGDADYSIGLQILGTGFSILVVPVMAIAVEAVFGVAGSFDPFAMSRILLTSVALPLGAGLLLGRLLPGWRTPIALWAGRIGNAALLIAAVAVLFVIWPDILRLIGGGVLWVTGLTIAFALFVGHMLGGPDPGNRGALAVACAARHPAVAIALSTGVFPDEAPAIVAVVELFLIANVVITIPYMRWRSRVMRLRASRSASAG